MPTITTTFKMKVEPIQQLLSEARDSYFKRNLKDASILANDALEKAKKEEFLPGIVRAGILISQIDLTVGKYENNPLLISKALETMSEIQNICTELDDRLMDAEIIMVRGEILMQQHQFENALKCFNDAIEIYIDLDNLKGQILCLVQKSHLAELQNDFKAALDLAESANKFLLKNKQNPDYVRIEVYHQLSQLYLKKQEYHKIENYASQTLELSRKNGDLEKESMALNSLAIVKGVNSDYMSAMQFFLESLDKSNLINYKYNIANLLINIGTIYAHLFNYDDALDRYQTALTDYKNVLNSNTLIIAYNNVGNIYSATKQHRLAMDYFNKAYELAISSNYKEMTAHALSQISKTNIALDNENEALINAQKAQEIFEELGSKVNGKQINFLNLGYLSFLKKSNTKAINLAKKAIDIAREYNDDASEMRGFQLLTEIYASLKDFEQAYYYQNILYIKQGEYAQLQRNRQILDMEIRYSIKEKQRKIETLTKENEYQALLISQSDQISKQNSQLVRVNEELKQFAYVASHDLKEPLRMIGSFSQLLFKRFGSQFNEDGKMYFEYIHEGVSRMNGLLDALLQYATIGNIDNVKTNISLEDVLMLVQGNLRMALEESNGFIIFETLPEVLGVQSQLVQLFQNLISNAIKFRKTGVSPEIHITSEDVGSHYLLKVKDNGIGIAPEHYERVFVIFQRLHTRAQYEGTGIGLAICQKIIQQHNGKIWLESQPDEGATFCFTLQKGIIN